MVPSLPGQTFFSNRQLVELKHFDKIVSFRDTTKVFQGVYEEIFNWFIMIFGHPNTDVILWMASQVVQHRWCMWDVER